MSRKIYVRPLSKGLHLLFVAMLIAGLAASVKPTTYASAQDSVPITLTIWRVIEFENQDAGEDTESGRGDYCATVGFSGSGGGVEFTCP
ncbi:MAG TPA: hypothetical protein VMJ90_08110, partial [Anaerolineales bacterium]|nr:hypothetical protein [Anaerolineales bacterium]